MAGENVLLLNAAMQNNRTRIVWIVEGGYCTDTRYSDKHRRKETQHEHLQTLLQARGFEVTLLPLILGFTGAIWIKTVSALAVLGIEKAQAQNPLCYLHAHAVQTHHTSLTQYLITWGDGSVAMLPCCILLWFPASFQITWGLSIGPDSHPNTPHHHQTKRKTRNHEETQDQQMPNQLHATIWTP